MLGLADRGRGHPSNPGSIVDELAYGASDHGMPGQLPGFAAGEL
jgi:hypothetical protein